MTINFDIIQTPDVTLQPEDPLCENEDPINLVFSPPTGGIWTGASGGVFNPDGIVGLNDVTYEVANGICIGDTTIMIEVFEAPEVQISTIPNLCIDESIFTVNATPTGGDWRGDVESMYLKMQTAAEIQ